MIKIDHKSHLLVEKMVKSGIGKKLDVNESDFH